MLITCAVTWQVNANATNKWFHFVSPGISLFEVTFCCLTTPLNCCVCNHWCHVRFITSVYLLWHCRKLGGMTSKFESPLSIQLPIKLQICQQGINLSRGDLSNAVSGEVVSPQCRRVMLFAHIPLLGRERLLMLYGISRAVIDNVPWDIPVVLESTLLCNHPSVRVLKFVFEFHCLPAQSIPFLLTYGWHIFLSKFIWEHPSVPWYVLIREWLNSSHPLADCVLSRFELRSSDCVIFIWGRHLFNLLSVKFENMSSPINASVRWRSMTKQCHRHQNRPHTLLLRCCRNSVSLRWTNDRCVIRWRFFIITSWYYQAYLVGCWYWQSTPTSSLGTDLIDCLCWALVFSCRDGAITLWFMDVLKSLARHWPSSLVDVLSIVDVIMYEMSS